MKNINLEFFCKNCKENVKITKKNLLPNREFGCDVDEFLIFEGRCPNCLDISHVDGTKIPDEVKLELLDKYAGISSATIGLWVAERDLKKAKDKVQKEKENLQKSIVRQKEREQEPGYQKRLFPHWGTIEQSIKAYNSNFSK